MDVDYKRITPLDALTYRAIRLECLLMEGDNFGSTYEAESAKPQLAFETHIEKRSRDHFVIGAFMGHGLIGICCFSRQERAKLQHSGMLLQMYVQHSYRGKQIGSGLVKKLIEEAFAIDGIEQITLGVVTENTAAVKLYQKMGFTIYGTLPHYFKYKGVYKDEHLMVLNKLKAKN